MEDSHTHEDEEMQVASLGETAEDMIRARIAHTLAIFPKLSPSMLQVGIGTGLPPGLWHPVLDRMIHEGLVTRRQARATNPVTKREQTYTILEVAGQQQAA